MGVAPDYGLKLKSQGVPPDFEEEIKNARAGHMTVSTTGTALILSPLYDQSSREIDGFIMEQGIKVRLTSRSDSVSNCDGYIAGRDAANSISTRSDGVGHKAVAAIGHR